MKIVFILKESLNRCPPALSTVKHLLALGHELLVIATGIQEDTRQELEQGHCRCMDLSLDSPLSSLPKIGKVFQWKSFQSQVLAVLKKENFDLLWLGSADATLAVGTALFRYRYVLQILELYDMFPFYRNRLGEYMRRAEKVLVPEEVRAHIFRAWYQLKETPVVLPNKPFGHPRKRNLPITDPRAAEAFAKIPGDARILFYQGQIYKDRDLRPLARAVQNMDGKIVFAVQGKIFNDDYCKDFFKNYNPYYIPFVPAPHHLEVTSNVHIGLLTYKHNQENNEFCAPNKIWEYTGFGLPLLGNDVYGLKRDFEAYNIGIPVNFDSNDPKPIREALEALLNREEEFAANAARFFSSVDNAAIIAKILKNFAEK